MDKWIIDFVKNFCKTTEQTGKIVSSKDFAKSLNNAGIKTTRGSTYSGMPRGIDKFLGIAQRNCFDRGDKEGCYDIEAFRKSIRKIKH